MGLSGSEELTVSTEFSQRNLQEMQIPGYTVLFDTSIENKTSRRKKEHWDFLGKVATTKMLQYFCRSLTIIKSCV